MTEYVVIILDQFGRLVLSFFLEPEVASDLLVQ